MNKGTGMLLLLLLWAHLLLRADVEPNADPGSATPLPLSSTVMGTLQIDPGDLDDWYVVSLADCGALTTTLNCGFSTLTGRVWLYDAGLNLLAVSTISGASTDANGNCMAAGLYYLRVERWTNSGNYSIKADFSAVGPAGDAEPNDILAEALPIVPNEIMHGSLGYSNASAADGEDWYAFDSESLGALNITCDFQGGLSGRIWLYNATGGSLGLSVITSGTANLAYTAALGATFYVRVERWSGCGGYALMLDNNCPRPVNLRTDTTLSVGTFIKWDHVSESNKYRVQRRKVGEPAWEPAIHVNIPKDIWYPLDACTDYEFRVESRCGDRSSGYSTPKQFKTLCEPICFTPTDVFVNTTTTTTAQIGWNGEPIDVGYKIEYVVDGDFSTVFERTPSPNMVQLSGLSPGTTYLFRLSARCLGNGTSGYAYGSFTTATFREAAEETAPDPAQISLSPNPATDWVNLRFDEATTGYLEVSNIMGQVVLSEKFNAQKTMLDVSRLGEGWYQIRLVTTDGAVKAINRVLIIQK